MMTRRSVVAATGASVLAASLLGGCSREPDYETVARAVRATHPPADDPDLAFLVQHAVLAANSHNTQPWRFSRDVDTVRVLPDLSRRTPVVDGDDHHLFASLGCAAENLALAAGASGRAPAVEFDATGEGHVAIDMSAGGGHEDPLFAAIAARQCTRSDFDGRTVPPQHLEALVEASRIDGCEVILITARPRIEQALEMILAANASQLENPAFVAELKQWIRFNEGEAVVTRDGLYSGCTGNPSVPGWLGRLAMPFLLTADGENDRIAAQVRSSAGLAVFVTERDDKAHWVAAGRSYQRFALQATVLGIRHAFLNQPLEVAAMRPRFASWLGVGARRPDLLIRFGYAEAMPRSLRRPVEAVIA